MTKIKMHIFKVKLPFYLPCEVKCGLQNEVSSSFKIRKIYNYNIYQRGVKQGGGEVGMGQSRVGWV